MGILASAWTVVNRWYISLVLAAVAGIVIGYFVFFNIFPGKPKIGIIDVPFAVLTPDAAFVITAFLDFARQDDDIKAVVIKLNSPGGFSAPSEQLFIETRKLREKKPVVIAVEDIAASGGYKWSLGANYTYAKAGSIVGSVGVFITNPGPSIPQIPDESVIRTGPQKLLGGSRRDSLRMLAGITHIKLPGPKQRTILDESHRSITHGCRQPSKSSSQNLLSAW